MNKLNPSFYLIADPQQCKKLAIETIVEIAVQSGVTMVQLRDKSASEHDIFQMGKRLKKILKKYQVPLIINDHVAIVKALDCDGVHLGQQDLSYARAKKILGKDKIIGISVSNLHETEIAESYDADYLGIGPIFFTPTKADAAPALGLAALKKLRNKSRHRLVAIGGINLSNANEVMTTGVDGIAIASAICTAEFPRQITQQIKRMINAALYARINHCRI